jgi:tripartite ATP-independent transporter DctP family solute receptor
MKKALLLSLSLLLAGLLFSACGDSSPTPAPASSAAARTEPAKEKVRIELSAGQPFNSTHPWGLGFEHLARLLKEKTDGQITLSVYHGHSIANGNTRTMVEMILEGTADLMINSPLVYQGWDKRYCIFSLPFLFPSSEVGFKAMKSDIGLEARNWLKDKGMFAVGVTVNGYRELSNSRRPVVSPADINGLKIRVPDASTIISTFNLLNADPTSLNMPEVYTSIQQGTVDGQENPVAVIDSNKLYEVCPYITLWTYMWDPAFMMMHTGSYDRIPADLKPIFDECVEETTQFINQALAEKEAEQIKGFVDYGCEVVTLSDEQNAAFATATADVYTEYRDLIGGDIVDAFLAAVKEASGQ